MKPQGRYTNAASVIMRSVQHGHLRGGSFGNPRRSKYTFRYGVEQFDRAVPYEESREFLRDRERSAERAWNEGRMYVP